VEAAAQVATFGLAHVSSHVHGPADAAEVTAYGTSTVNLSKTPFFTPTQEFFPVVGAGIDDFETGDKVTFTFDPGFGLITEALDVKDILVAVQPDGNEKLTVGFV